jgi:hypothetical protein
MFEVASVLNVELSTLDYHTHAEQASLIAFGVVKIYLNTCHAMIAGSRQTRFETHTPEVV